MNSMEPGDRVYHNVGTDSINGGLAMMVDDVENGEARFTVDDEYVWIPLDQLVKLDNAEERMGFI